MKSVLLSSLILFVIQVRQLTWTHAAAPCCQCTDTPAGVSVMECLPLVDATENVLHHKEAFVD